MVEVGKLTANVDRLLDENSKQGAKLETLTTQATYIKGMMAAAVILIGAFIFIGGFVLDARWDAAIQALVGPAQTTATDSD